jgi:LmbE family N-acetylglucosaminyl deacetylase
MCRRIVVLALLALTFASSLPAAQRPPDSADLQLALRKLTVLGSALYVAAHPDDENTALLAYWSKDRLYRTGYLAMTRGDGGQNIIGDEKGPMLGVIRTQELLAARRIDGAEQFFTRAVDFGYSKNPQETLGIWGHDTILADVVWVIRKFQPDVIVTRFPTTGEGGHGHHTASAILAGEAFTAAADPTKFPEQLRQVNVWQPKRLFWNRFSWQPLDPNDPRLAKSLRIDLGAYNPLLGRAYTEIAGESRSQHKSQGFGAAERRGSNINYFEPTTGQPAQNDLFDGIDTSWSRYPGGETVGKVLEEAAATFDPAHPSKTIPLLLQANELLDRLGATPAWAPDVNPWIAVQRRELLEAIKGCAGLAIDVNAADSAVTPGGEIPVSVTVINRSDYPFILSTVASLYANPGKAPGKRLEYNVPVKTDLTIKLPADFPISQPYWLRKPPSKGTYNVDDPQLIGLAENPPAIPLTVSLDDGRMHTLIFSVPAIFRWVDPVRGEETRRLDVVPDVTTNLDAGVLIFPDTKPKHLTVTAKNFDGASSATARVKVPQGWSVTPASVPLKFNARGDEVQASFTITPPKSESAGTLEVETVLAGGRSESLAIETIEYEHIPRQRLFPAAQARLVRADIRKRGSRIGYIMGSGDEVPDALRQIGFDVTLLSDADLERGEFGQYDAVVVGVRAFNRRKRLGVVQPKLLDYVRGGGTLVAQYNTLDDGIASMQIGPYPFTITHDRVTVEDAPVRLLDAASPLLNVPNRITPADFDGWVQERGLYFAQKWDPRYTTVISSNDPGEPPLDAGILVARVGKGVFVYTSYAWFRQLPAGVPGAYRLFANLVSAR